MIDSRDLYAYLLSDQFQFYVNQFAKESLQFSLEVHLEKNFSTDENIDWLKELSDCQGRPTLNVIDKIILDIQSKDYPRRLSAIKRSGFF